jgi:hypothetical protein
VRISSVADYAAKQTPRSSLRGAIIPDLDPPYLNSTFRFAKGRFAGDIVDQQTVRANIGQLAV